MKKHVLSLLIIFWCSSSNPEYSSHATFQSNNWQQTNSTSSNNPIAVATSFVSCVYAVINFFKSKSPKSNNTANHSEQARQSSDIPYWPDHKIYSGLPLMQSNQTGQLISLNTQSQEILQKKDLGDEIGLFQIQSGCAPNDIVQQRQHAVASIKANGAKYVKQFYLLDEKAQQYLQENQIDPAQFLICNGHQLQQVIHQELVSILQTASSDCVHRAINDNESLGKTVALFAQVGSD